MEQFQLHISHIFIFRRVSAQRPSKLSGAAGPSPGGGQHFAHIFQTLEGNNSQTAAQSFDMTNARGPNSSATPSATASSGVLMVGPNFKVWLHIVLA
ncbi:unnamed protein product [Onchocerca flexuosa]|uniref:AT-hook motif nuclear-localized protein n=1 Tax=Onchocerca flexuosa TaxID=387005 RepID=A0A183HM76_9BILA|nr:unnamed protein product [Onchocerca flexuosa]